MWRKRRWVCPDPDCPAGTFSEDCPQLVRPRGKLTTRAVWWAISQLHREHASVAGVARQLGVDWHTAWNVIRPELEAMSKDESRFAGVAVLGVDEHVWHHTPHKIKDKGPKEMTGIVDLSRDSRGKTHARLLDLAPGRSGRVYQTWLSKRGPAFTQGTKIATLDPFRGYANAIDTELGDAAAVLDAFHVTKLGVDVVDEVRRRIQQETTGHRGRKDDPLYKVRNVLRAGADRLTTRQWDRLQKYLPSGDPHGAVWLAWQCYQRLRSVYHLPNLTEAKKVAENILATFHTCPVPEVARLGRTLRRWKDQFLGYFTTNRANNGGTEALDGIVELHRRIARGFRNKDNYRLRMILVGGGLTHPELR
ncbi:ISL3 family transposase [Georgenia sp. 10Sc9-8]|uniref:ISL3 family transposase n=1 Tax=Georgenia halotolerans TaxID=3028317 RepID=A0ABT5TZ95_9MICO|nr:ISL3 family transposase [Georgenia halotolerans]